MLLQAENRSSSQQIQDYHPTRVDVSNILLLRLINLTSHADLTGVTPKIIEPTSQSPDHKTSLTFSEQGTLDSDCQHGPETAGSKHQHGFSRDHHVNSSAYQKWKHDQSLLRKMSEKIQKTRNSLAHGDDVSVSEVHNCFQKVERFLVKGAGKTLTNKLVFLKTVDTGLNILKTFALQVSANKDLFDKEILSSIEPTSEQARLLLSGPRELVGREEVLQQLSFLMRHPQSVCSEGLPSAALWPRVLVHGQPGIGKTAVVRALSRRLEKPLPQQCAFQGSTEPALLADISLFLKVELQTRDVSSPAVRSNFKNFLCQTTKVFFFVFEDVRDPNMVMPLLPQNNHCVIFTNSSDLSWRENGFIPGRVTGFPLHGLNEEDSLKLVSDVLIGEGSSEHTSMLQHLVEQERLSNFLSKNMMGVPLALRLVAFQICHLSPTTLSEMLKEINTTSEEWSAVDKDAAGRVHVRGFHHVVRHAMNGILTDTMKMTICFALSILECSGPQLMFVDLLVQRLNFTRLQVESCLESLIKTGLVTRLEDDFIMHQVVQGHVRNVISSSFAGIKELVVTALLQVFKKETVYSTKVTLSEKAASFPLRLQSPLCCFTLSEQKRSISITTLQCPELMAGGVIFDFLDKADSLQLSWKQRSACFHCLLWCYEHCRAGRKLIEAAWDVARKDFYNSLEEMRLYDLASGDEETVYEVLNARWTIYRYPFFLISSDISRQLSMSKSTNLISLLYCGASILLKRGETDDILTLFSYYQFSPDTLVSHFDRTGDEYFCRSALTCVLALSSCKGFQAGRQLFDKIIRAWLPKSSMFTVECHEEIVRTAYCFSANCRSHYLHRDLEMLEVTYMLCNIDKYSQCKPDLVLDTCIAASFVLTRVHHLNPKVLSRTAIVWLHRGLHGAETAPPKYIGGVADKLTLLVACQSMFGCGEKLFAEVPDLWKNFGAKVVPFVSDTTHRSPFRRTLDLKFALILLLLMNSQVETLSDFDPESVTLFCRGLAQVVCPVSNASNVVEALHSGCQKFNHWWKRGSTMLQSSVMNDKHTTAWWSACNHVLNIYAGVLQRFDPSACTRLKAPKEHTNFKADRAVNKEVLRIFAKELLACGKVSHATVLQELLQRLLSGQERTWLIAVNKAAVIWTTDVNNAF